MPWAWLIIAVLIAMDTLWMHADGMHISAKALVIAVGFTGLLLALSLFYSRFRPDQRLALLTDYSAKLLSYSVSVGIFCYLIVSLRQPLVDAQLADADRAVGFDWLATYGWVSAHPMIRTLLIVAYDSTVPQLGILMLLLVSTRRYDRAAFLLWFYMGSSALYIVISGLWPAAGAFGYYQAALDTPYVQQFYALRAGAMTTLDLTKLQGVVQFPSFHLALAVSCAYVTRRIRYVFPCFVILNILVIAATPAIGGHYFVDLWSSALLTALLIFLTEQALKAHAGKTA